MPSPPSFFDKIDGFVKSPSAALRCILRHCGVQPLRALHLELFTLPSILMTFYEIIKVRFPDIFQTRAE
ncbi:MAG: hypothetical protein NTY64_14520 [Deltaproteobacteria bacterium]|nr:hypothetical protein [Deltaproteobacteria bacterium]